MGLDEAVGVFAGHAGFGEVEQELELTWAELNDLLENPPPFDLSGTPMILTFRRILEECKTVAEA